MTEREYELTVRVRLSDTMDDTPLMVLNSLVLGSLQDGGVPVLHVESHECEAAGGVNRRQVTGETG